MVQTGLRILRETPTRFWAGSLRRVQEGRSTAVACLTGRRLPPVRSPRCASGPRLGGHVCVQLRPRGTPAAPPPRLRPPRLQGFAQARRPVRRAGHGGLEPALPQLPSHLAATLLALTVGGRPRAEHVPPRATKTPDPPEAGLPAPAAARLLDGLPPPRGALNATAGAAPQRRRRVGQAVRHGTASTRGDHQRAQRLRPGPGQVALGPPPGLPLDEQPREAIPGPTTRRPACGALRFPPSPDWGPGHRHTPAAVCTGPASDPCRSP